MKKLVLRAIALSALQLAASAAFLGAEPHQHVLQATDDHGHAQVPAYSGRLPKPRVAIIGGGAAGTSSAFFLSYLAAINSSLSVDVDLFEANDYLGGRSTTVYPFDNDTYPAIELGASIFVKANRNLWKATKQFNLTLQGMHGGDEEDAGGMSIFDGQDFVYTETSGFGWWNMAKLFWRYGYSPMTVKNTVADTVAKFTHLYADDFQSRGPYETIQQFAAALSLDGLACNSTKEYLKSLAVSELFIQELVAAATRVNYGQNPSHLQAFEGMVSMAANGASSIEGGNRQLFERFAAHSDARIHLGTRLTSIEHANSMGDLSPSNMPDPTRRTWSLRYEDVEDGRTALQTYDAIIYASPMHSALPSYSKPVNFIHSDIPLLIPKLPYVYLHVTLVATNATTARPEFFGKKKGEVISRTILSTFEPFESGKSKVRPRINSLNYLRSLGKVSKETGHAHVVKIFSENEFTDSLLQEAFGSNEVLWVHRKEWPAYPISPAFAPDEDFATFKPDPSENFYYPNAFERWVSTMETETVAAWNCVGLLVRDMFGYQVTKSWANWDDASAETL